MAFLKVRYYQPSIREYREDDPRPFMLNLGLIVSFREAHPRFDDRGSAGTIIVYLLDGTYCHLNKESSDKFLKVFESKKIESFYSVGGEKLGGNNEFPNNVVPMNAFEGRKDDEE